jgi:hypothetical protein
MKKATESITIPLINLNVLVLINHKSKKSAMKSLSKSSRKIFDKIIEEDDFHFERPAGYTFYTNEKTAICGYHVLMFRNSKDEDFIGNVNHEVTHLMQKIRRIFWNGHQEREFEAYMSEWVFKQVLEISKSL